MPTVFVADALASSRAALAIFLQDLNLHVVGEASDWATTLATAPVAEPDILLLAGGLLPPEASAALTELRGLCPKIVIVILSLLDAREPIIRSAKADAFISRYDTPERVVAQLLAAAQLVPSR